MHYYTFYAKDYASKASFLEPMEDLAYRRMLDLYYLTEQPLPESVDEIALLIRMRSHSDCIAVVLRYFFELTASGYINKKVETILSEYHAKSVKAKASADARWAKVKDEKNKKPIKNIKLAQVCDNDANALRTECEMDANYKPITINQELLTNNITLDKPKKNSVIKKLIPSDFGISEGVRKWAFENNHHNLEKHLEGFIDYANSGAKKYADWDSAFKRAIREDWFKVNKPVYQNNYQQPQNTRMQEIEELSKQWELENESNYQPY